MNEDAPDKRSRRNRLSMMTLVLLARMRQYETKFPSRAQFLRAIGISEGTYYLMLQRSSNPTIETMEKIAEGLGVTVYDLIGNIDQGTLSGCLSAVGLDLEKLKTGIEKREEANLFLDTYIESLGPVKHTKPPKPRKSRAKKMAGNTDLSI